LDDFLSTLSHEDQQRVTLVKIDAEGAEPLILEGLASFIERKSALTIICELVPGFYTPDHPSRYVRAPADLVSDESAAFLSRMEKVDGRASAFDCRPDNFQLGRDPDFAAELGEAGVLVQAFQLGL